MGYLVDSNVLIDYVAERFKIDQLKSLDLIFDEALNVSVITKIEIFGYNGEPKEESKMIIFFDNAEIIPLNEDIVEQTIKIRKAVKMKTPDAIIAATALVNQYTLITNNTSDFKRIPGLKLFSPYEF